MWHYFIWLEELGKNIQINVFVWFSCTTALSIVQEKRESENWRVRARLWIEISGPSPADTHAGRSQAHHVARVCPEPPSSNDTFATRLSLSDLQRTRDERRRGGAEDESYCLSRTLSLYPPSPGGQLPSPLTGAPSSPPLYRSPALQLQKHLPLNMQSACQGIRETYIHTNVAAGVKLIFTDIRSVRTYSPLIWSWRRRPERWQMILNSTRTAIPNLMSKTSRTSSCPLSTTVYYCILSKPRSFTVTFFILFVWDV